MLCVGNSSGSKMRFGPHGASPHTPRREAYSFVFLKFSGRTSQNLTARTTTKLCFGGSFGEMFDWRNLPGEICLRNLPGEICRRNLLVKFAGESCLLNLSAKLSPIFGESRPNFSTCKLHRSQKAPPTHPKTLAFSVVGPKETAEVKGLCVFTICRLERQARGTMRGAKAGCSLSFCSHVSLVGLSLRKCIRWHLGLGPSDSRLHRNFSGCKGF